MNEFDVVLSSAVSDGHESDQRVLECLKIDLAKDGPEDLTRNHLRTADELMERCPASFWRSGRSRSFIQYRRQTTSLSRYQHSQLMTASYDSRVSRPVVASSQGASCGILLRICADVDSITKNSHETGVNIKPTTLALQLVELERVLQSERATSRHALRVGNVYSSRMWYGYVFWECPWFYWNKCWPTAALFAATNCSIRFVSIMSIIVLSYFLFLTFTFLQFFIFFFLFLGLNFVA
jgi:hypothetical protein